MRLELSKYSQLVASVDKVNIDRDLEELYKLTGNPQVVIFESMNAIRGFGTTRIDGTLATGNYTIPKGVTSIGICLFGERYSLQKIFVPIGKKRRIL